MAVVYDPITGFAIGDPDEPSVQREQLEAAIGLSASLSSELLTSVKTALEGFILSASGFRKVFAVDGNEESFGETISAEDALLCGFFALEYERLVQRRLGTANQGKAAQLQLVVGVDARPTGPAIADVIVRVLANGGASVNYLFIVAAPEIMAYTKVTPGLTGFIYVSASHNPIGHNGIKFGLNRGGVLEPSDAEELIQSIRTTATSPLRLAEALAEVASRVLRLSPREVADIYNRSAACKKEAADSYFRFTERVVSGETDETKQRSVLEDLKRAVDRNPIGILGELNGSARGTSIDRSFLEKLGVRISLLNGNPREVVHRIVPEGDSLDLARGRLRELHQNESSFRLAYVPDNDGDRGNLVYYDSRIDEVLPVSAQDVFALACVAELAWLVYTGTVSYDASGRALQKVAIAVNGPTSMRIDRIAEAFDATVYRAEVGEANVVELARLLRKKGYIVRILGEGSNGGNITYPASVRDPLNTVMAMVKLLSVGSSEDGSRPGLFDIWRKRNRIEATGTAATDLGAILSTLPRFVTTSSFDKRAVMKIRTGDHGRLKSEYERLFLEQWQERRDELRERFGIIGWRQINYDGVNERQGVGTTVRGANERGGFKIVFKDENGKIKAFIWMRGSGTEPVFRVMADVEGSNVDNERYFLDWHISMVERADRAASGVPAR